MKIKLKPNEIFDEYEKGTEYNSSIDLYDNVKKNEEFYLGDQWNGVNAPDLTKPVFNIIKRVVTYYVSQIVSDDVGVHISPFEETEEKKALSEIVAGQVESVLERTKTNFKARSNIRNCAVDGDTCMFITFNPDIQTNQQIKGDIETEIIDNTNVIFGNPYSIDTQKQPYIIIVQRLYVDSVRDMAVKMGMSKEKAKEIRGDSETAPVATTMDTSDDLVTVLTKFWKEDTEVVTGIDPIMHTEIKQKRTSVHYTKVTQNVVLKEDTDTGYVDYPIAYMTWDRVKDSYHGRSPVTGLIPNQIFVNKIYAMCMVYMTNMGFPKVFYDSTKLGKLTNDVTKAVALPNMDMAGKMMDSVRAPDFSNQIIQLIDSTIQYTKDFMGASDAALGELSNPQNTSAIVAVQQASSAPLEIQKLDFYQFYEDIVRAIVDIMACSYGIRNLKVTEDQAKALDQNGSMIDHIEYIDPLTGQQLQPALDPVTGEMIPPVGSIAKPVYKTTIEFNFAQLRNMNYDINVEIGQSTYWSEASTIQTLDNMWDKGIITDPVIYLESIPDKYIPNKEKIIDSIKNSQQQTQMQYAQESQPMVDENGNPVTAGMTDGIDNRASAVDVDNQQLQDTYAKSKEYYQ